MDKAIVSLVQLVWLGRGIGISFILISSAYGGYLVAKGYGRRLEELRELQHLFLLMEGELDYGGYSLGEIFIRCGKLGNGVWGGWMRGLGEELLAPTEEGFGILWEKHICLKGGQSALSTGEREELRQLGNRLEGTDRDTQIKGIHLYLERLNRQEHRLNAGIEGIYRVWLSLGILTGIFLVILLV